MKKIILVNNIENVNFWYNTFKPRKKTYLKETLKRLKKSVSMFETWQDNQDKQTAIKILLN
jgi:hypothetical protein